MKKKDSSRDEVVLTARIPAKLHATAKTKMIRRRESFQDVIRSAIERYAQAGDDIDEQTGVRRSQNPLELIAALQNELAQHKLAESTTTYGAIKTTSLTMYIRDIRKALENLERICATGDSLATTGSNMLQESENVHKAAAGESGGAANGTEAGDRERARNVIGRAERAIEHARERTERDSTHHPEKKRPHKKAS